MGRIKILDEGKVDPVLSVLNNDSRVFQEHWYTFTPPPHAVPLANSLNQERPHCEAFRVGSFVYGLQFHPR